MAAGINARRGLWLEKCKEQSGQGRRKSLKQRGGCSDLSNPPVSTHIERCGKRAAFFLRRPERKMLWGEPPAVQPPSTVTEWLPPGEHGQWKAVRNQIPFQEFAELSHRDT